MGIATDTPIGERRSAPRMPVRRKAVVICADGAVPHVTGTAVDMSCDGTGIRVSRPLSRGQAVEIEMQAPEGDPHGSEIRARGRVVRVQMLGGHDCVLGIYFTRSAWPSHAAALRGHPIPALLREPAHTAARPARTRSGSRLKRAVSGIGLLLLLCLLGLLWPGEKPMAGAAARSSRTLETPEEDSPAPARTPDALTDPAGPFDPVQEAATGIAHAGPVPAAALRGRYVSGVRRGASARPGPFASLAQDAGGGMEGRPVALLAAFEGGEPGPGLKGAPPLPSNGGTGAQSVGADEAAGVPSGMPGEAATEAAQAPDDREKGVFLDIDRSAFRMRVYVDGHLAAEFPVGVGRNGATPLGEFTIANKISRPAWFHRGETVPYGDPRNPLGESWMGFASGGVPISYGIHPTQDRGSIGAATGAGCIRMHPEDAASLFRLCPRGAAVRIYDSAPLRLASNAPPF